MNIIRNILSQYTWDLAFGLFDEQIITKGFDMDDLRLVKNPYKKKWFADPFILSENEQSIQVLVEEFDTDIHRGRIARLSVEKPEYKITECSIILELDTHLSFPAIYRFNGNIYVHPENSASGKSLIYKYDQELDKLVDPIVLVEKPLTDAIINIEGNHYKMYSTLIPDNGGPLLHVFKSESLIKPFEEIGTIDFGDKTARMAGAYIDAEKGLVRPSQDCTHDYGEAVLFYVGKNIVGEIRPKKYGKYEGIHTFNTLGNTFVVDLKKYRYAYLRNFLKRVLGKK